MTSVLRSTLLYARYSLLQTVRVPMSWVGNLVFPTLVLCVFVLPQPDVVADPAASRDAVLSLATFAVMTSSLFGLGLGVAQNREHPWTRYTRTLPAPASARILSETISTGCVSVVAVLPVLLVGLVCTAADFTPGELLGGYLALAVSALPFMMLGIAVGNAFPAKAAIAVVQILMFGLAFGGGLFLAPSGFPHWAADVSLALPTRQAREFVLWAGAGAAFPGWLVLGLVGWTVVFFALALWLVRRDQSRGYA